MALSQSQFIELRLDWLPQPADARWNGAPPEAFDPAAHNMTPYGTFPDEGFPIIA